MLTLGIETSCDETSCAVLKDRDEIRSNIVSSSLFRHKPFGGVVPEIASRHCLEQIDIVFHEALREAKVKARDLDLVAVTQGPGLIGSLLVGVSFAKTIAYQLGIPLVAVNHLEAHLVANFIGAVEPEHYIGLLVSGGHTALTYHYLRPWSVRRSRGVMKVKLLGSTVDDAVGEAYDKVAKILGLGYPGGPIIDKLAREGNPQAFRFTKPKQDKRFDFSFSGIKTAVLYEVRKCHPESFGACHSERSEESTRLEGKFREGSQRSFGPLGLRMTEQFVRDMAASFQSAAVEWLTEKALAAAEFKKTNDIVVGGGVSANSHLRKVLTEEGASRGLKVWFPPLSLTGDNAAMIARRGFELYQKGKRSTFSLTGDPNLKAG